MSDLQETPTPCDHRFVFLRQEAKPVQRWGDRIERRQIVDVFYCERCCGYNQVLLRTEVPDSRSFGWVEVP